MVRPMRRVLRSSRRQIAPKEERVMVGRMAIPAPAHLISGPPSPDVTASDAGQVLTPVALVIS